MISSAILDIKNTCQMTLNRPCVYGKTSALTRSR